MSPSPENPLKAGNGRQEEQVSFPPVSQTEVKQIHQSLRRDAGFIWRRREGGRAAVRGDFQFDSIQAKGVI